jgi:hypothetical protein
MGFKEWSTKQEDAKAFGDLLVDTFSGCTKEDVSDVDFVTDTLLNKYGHDTMKWIYSIDESSRQQGWGRFNETCLKQ